MLLLAAFSVLFACFLPTGAVPALGLSLIDTNPLGQPFVNAILPVQPGISPRFTLFRRQGCPNLSLLCPSDHVAHTIQLAVAIPAVP